MDAKRQTFCLHSSVVTMYDIPLAPRKRFYLLIAVFAATSLSTVFITAGRRRS